MKKSHLQDWTENKAFTAFEIHLTQELESTTKRYGTDVAQNVRVWVRAIMMMIITEHRDDPARAATELMATIETIAGWNKRIDNMAASIESAFNRPDVH